MPGRIERIVIWTLACLVPCIALAQVPQWPMPQDVERAWKANPFPDAARIDAQPIPRPPRMDAPRGSVDIEALVRAKALVPNTGATPESAPSPLRIFITLDMPRASLQLLTDQASRAGAVLVLRGLKAQSMRETLALVRELMGEHTVAWVIDPEAFTRFGVHHAPTFVLALDEVTAANAEERCTSGCATPAAFVSVAGDVSLDYALEAILRRRPQAAPRAEPFLKRLRAL